MPYIISPKTNRKIKIGSKTYINLVRDGILPNVPFEHVKITRGKQAIQTEKRNNDIEQIQNLLDKLRKERESNFTTVDKPVKPIKKNSTPVKPIITKRSNNLFTDDYIKNITDNIIDDEDDEDNDAILANIKSVTDHISQQDPKLLQSMELNDLIDLINKKI